MISMTSLWLPILLSAVFVFVVSSIIHMAIPIHKGDFKKLPGEEKILAEMRTQGVRPGSYGFPCCESMKEMGSPEFIENLKRGPVMILQVRKNGPDSMGRRLAMWFVYSIVVGIFAALVAGSALPAGASYHIVFHLVALTAFVGYALALWQLSIWYDRPWMLTIKSTLDGLIYALLTAGTFGWLWPR